MKRDDIIRMAREAGFYFHDAGYAPILHTVAGEYSEACFERFAAIVAAAERDAILSKATKAQAVDGNCAIVLVADISARGTP